MEVDAPAGASVRTVPPHRMPEARRVRRYGKAVGCDFACT